MKTFAISGFGRIGRLAARVWYEHHRQDLDLVAINTSGSIDLEGWAHLLKYDTAYGVFKGEISTEQHQSKDQASDADPLLGHIILDGKTKIPVLAQRDPEKLPWEKYSASLVIEATGVFRTEELASKHLKAGAKKVLLSAPGKGGNVETSVIGVSEGDPAHNIVSNASCTTNCTAPIVATLHKSLGIEKAMLTTIHAYTDDQKLQDGSHKDLRRARAAALNIIPTTTGAAKSTSQVVSGIEESKFDGISIRVPIITGSLIDLVLVTKESTSADEVNKILEEAANGSHKGVIDATREPLVSSDIIGRNESAIVDLEMTRVVGGNLVKIIAWYDNEWGFTKRMLELALSL